ncbi:MAG: hypothetical protein QM669_13265, partial [Siphonobacter sp.]
MKKPVKRLYKYLISSLGTVIVLAGVAMGAAYMYQDHLFKRVQQEINNRIQGTLSVEDFTIRFWDQTPGLLVVFQNVHLHDRQYGRHHRKFLTLREVRIRLDITSIFRKQIRIKTIHLVEGHLFAFREANGYANWTIFEKDSLSQHTGAMSSNNRGFLIEMNDLRLEKVSVHFADSLRHKWYGGIFQKIDCHIKGTPTGFKAQLRGPMHLNGLAFKSSKGSFGTNQETEIRLNLDLDTAAHRLTLEPSQLVFEQIDTLHARGVFQFHTQSPPDMQLFMNIRGIPLAKGLDLVPHSLAAAIGKFNVYPIVEQADIRLAGSMGPRVQPYIFIRFKTGPTEFASAIGLLNNLRTEGQFTNQANKALPPSDENSRLNFTKYNADFEYVLPISGRMVIHNLIHSRAFVTTHVN